MKHFERDDEATVRSILNDLVESGLVSRSGRGKNPTYRMATAEELEEIGMASAANSDQTNDALLWVHVSHAGPLRKEDLAEMLPLSEKAIDDALDRLLASARIRSEAGSDGVYYSTHHCLIPVGEAAGWEAAIIDHHRAVLSALAAKALNGRHASSVDDRVGGTTLSFDIWPGHPKEQQVLELLAATRQQVIALWDEVEQYNAENESDAAYQVTYYCGQYLKEDHGK
jgi:predicted transcriptional regulator